MPFLAVSLYLCIMNEIIDIPEYKLYNSLSALVEANKCGGMVELSKQYKLKECGFVEADFMKLVQNYTDNPSLDNRIDLICYMLKVILKNKPLYQMFSKLYTSAIDPE